MRYLILVIAFLTILFAANSLMDNYFAKRKEINRIIYLQNTTPKFLSCNKCGYSENESYFKDGLCPRCGNKIGG